MMEQIWNKRVNDTTPIDADRRALAKEILLKLIEISPQILSSRADTFTGSGGVELAWKIADAFLKAEKQL
jgi:hypothetical protein